MSENANNKDSFEELFQKKAGEYNIPFREEDWLKLEKKLDLQEAKIAYRRKVRWIAAASFLIVSLLGYFTYENHNRLNQISQQMNDETVNEIEQEGITEGRNEGLENQSVSSGDERDEAIAENNSDDSENNNSVRQSPDAPTMPLSGLEESEEEADSESGTLRVDGTLLTREVEAAFLVSDVTISKRQFYPNTYRTALNPTPTAMAAVQPASATSGEESGNDIDRIASTSSRITLGLATSPDLSTVGSISNFYDPGYKIGLTVGYKLTPNLSITSGIVQSKVRYSTTDGGGYNPPIYWTEGSLPNEMIAECLLLDIPVNLKYNFMNFSHSRFFATAGISSYIMLNEDYQFNYNRDDTGQIQNWNGRTGTRHWMSNAGFSIGYELDIHSNWSMQIEPFLKIPLRDVGWSNVKLYSMGSFVSLNYRL